MTPEQRRWYREEWEKVQLAVMPATHFSGQLHLKGVRNFSVYELMCKGTGLLYLNEPALKKLQYMRDLLNKPMILTSAFRSPEHNEAIGGAVNSMHMLGIAFDVSLIGHDAEHVEKIARRVGFTGIGRYPSQKFIHVDDRPWSETFGAKTWH